MYLFFSCVCRGFISVFMLTVCSLSSVYHTEYKNLYLMIDLRSFSLQKCHHIIIGLVK